MSRTQRYTAGQVVRALQEAKGLVTLAAKALDCAPSTVRRYRDRYPSVAEALYEEREHLVDISELALMKAVLAGEPWAVQMVLIRLGRDRGYGERVDLGVNLEGKVYVNFPEDEV